jgi:hypothetical protein
MLGIQSSKAWLLDSLPSLTSNSLFKQALHKMFHIKKKNLNNILGFKIVFTDYKGRYVPYFA